MSAPVTVVGSYLSPYVRKVLAVLHLKGIEYRIDPIVGFYADDRFTTLNPLRTIPVLVDDRVALADSSVICEYLEERHPAPALRPRDVADRARGRWLEEYADTRLGDVLIWRLFNEAVIGPGVWGRERDRAAIERVVREDVPTVLDYLETQLPAEGWLSEAPGIADLAVASFFRNAAMARYHVDATRWPLTATYVDRVLALECFTRVQPFEAIMLRTRVPEQRAALAAAGAPLTDHSYGTDRPRRGPMTRLPG